MTDQSRPRPAQQPLLEQYGPFMLPEEVALALRMKSKEALQVAISRRRLPLKPIRPLGGRKTLYSTAEVEELIKTWLDQSKST